MEDYSVKAQRFQKHMDILYKAAKWRTCDVCKCLNLTRQSVFNYKHNYLKMTNHLYLAYRYLLDKECEKDPTGYLSEAIKVLIDQDSTEEEIAMAYYRIIKG